MHLYQSDDYSIFPSLDKMRVLIPGTWEGDRMVTKNANNPTKLSCNFYANVSYNI